jgi:thiamine pyrophosphokinase
MSSHHIVREKQEPALLITGTHSFNNELLGQLLEWSPTVIVTGDTAEKVNAQGIKIDMLVTHEALNELQSDIRIIPAGNASATAAALQYLISNDYPALNVVADEVDLKDYLFFADKINLVIYSGQKKIYPVTSGFNKWKPAGEVITLITHPTDLYMSGLEPVGEHAYRTSHDGFFSLQFSQPFLFIAEDI